jgi:thiosulfate dehydrogenase [quinone] large subunit
MTSTTYNAAAASSRVSSEASIADRSWRAAGITLLAVRIIQGFIYWGGGSRRFIYAPSKLDAWGGHNWMANKFQTAMPGALFGTDHLISFLLQHFYLLYIGVIVFSAAELIGGAMLMAGLFTRFAALLTIGFSVLLMAMFGWQGATCIDEWTMAACNLAMGTTLLLAGGSAYSLDNVLLRRNPGLANKAWFRWAGGSLPLPLREGGFRTLSLALLALVLVYNIGTYSYYRGSVLTPFHGGPVSPTKHHVALTNGRVSADGTIRVHAYLDGGTPEAPLHIVQATLIGPDHATLNVWDAKALSALPKADFENDYAYNKFGTGPFGIRAPMGAKATITLPPRVGMGAVPLGSVLKFTDVDGSNFTTRLQAATH